MRSSQAKAVALGGVMAALAVVVMCLGGLIPIATFVCPVLCMVLLQTVCALCGSRIGWAWYGAVSILSVLLAPDKEAAAVFLGLGWYPIVKPHMDKWKLSLLWKLLAFNLAIAVIYGAAIRLLGLHQLAQDYVDMGLAGLCLTLVLGNVTFILLDLVLNKMKNRPK